MEAGAAGAAILALRGLCLWSRAWLWHECLRVSHVDHHEVAANAHQWQTCVDARGPEMHQYGSRHPRCLPWTAGIYGEKRRGMVSQQLPELVVCSAQLDSRHGNYSLRNKTTVLNDVRV